MKDFDSLFFSLCPSGTASPSTGTCGFHPISITGWSSPPECLGTSSKNRGFCSGSFCKMEHSLHLLHHFFSLFGKLHDNKAVTKYAPNTPVLIHIACFYSPISPPPPVILSQKHISCTKRSSLKWFKSTDLIMHECMTVL